MKSKLLLLLALSFLLACSSEKSKMQADINNLETALEETPNTENAKALIDAYQAYIDANPDDVEQNARYLYRSAGVQFRMNQFSGAVEALNQGLKDYYAASITPSSAELLGVIYSEKLRNQENANTIHQAMVQAFPDFEKIDEIKAKLEKANLPPIETRIENLGQRMFNDSLGRIEYRIANDFINSCQLHAMLLPGSEKSPEFLHKAGETARSIRAYSKALEFYEWICEQYPNYEKAPQALFLRAFTLDNDLGKIEEARVLYEEFLEKYPEDDFADDTQFLLENLGKDDEEIINSFNAQEQSSEQPETED